MRMTIISDTHNHHGVLDLVPGDFLIHCGDFSGQGFHGEVRSFFKWFAVQPFKYRILIAGNHDMSFEKEPAFKVEMVIKYKDQIMYLEDSGCEIEGIKFWGSPWQPEFCNWAFNLPRDGIKLAEKWAKIPAETNVLITHSPPHMLLDRCMHPCPPYPPNAGCYELRKRVEAIRPRLHVFGHVHEGYGGVERDGTTFLNASTCTLDYNPKNLPFVLEW